MVPYCEAMAAPQSGCARGECCLRQRANDDDLETIAERVVVEMLERHLEPPRPGRGHGLNVESSANLALALNQAFLGATIGTPHAASLRVVGHPDGVRDRDGVERYRVVKRPFRTTVLDFVMGGGLWVASSSRGTWIGHSLAGEKRA